MSTATRLQAVYEQIPRIECQGKCHVTCTWIGMVEAEAKAIVALSGEKLKKVTDTGQCGYLTSFKTCEVYEARPLVCRIWGVVQGLECPFGCKAERILTKEEGLAISRQIKAISRKNVMNF